MQIGKQCLLQVCTVHVLVEVIVKILILFRSFLFLDYRIVVRGLLKWFNLH